jgi:hypothetical protein
MYIYIVYNGRVILNAEPESVRSLFEILSQHPNGGTEENHKPVSRPGSESRTS